MTRIKRITRTTSCCPERSGTRNIVGANATTCVQRDSVVSDPLRIAALPQNDTRFHFKIHSWYSSICAISVPVFFN